MLMLNIFAIIITIFIVILLIGLLLEKEIFAKFLFLSSITNVIALMIVILGSYQYNESFLDIALIYSLLSFIASQGLLKFVIGRQKD